MKIKYLALVLSLLLVIFTGCAQQKDTEPSPSPTSQNTPTVTPGGTSPDVTTSASIVDNEAAFLKAVSSTGTWIICLTKDLNVSQDIVLAGEFKNGKKDENGQDIIQRKIALYTQDENRNITNRFTLTAPKLTIESPKASIQHGTFKGDIYVSAKDFELVDATVEGNIYFTNDDAKNTFKMDDKSKVTGVQELKK